MLSLLKINENIVPEEKIQCFCVKQQRLQWMRNHPYKQQQQQQRDAPFSLMLRPIKSNNKATTTATATSTRSIQAVSTEILKEIFLKKKRSVKTGIFSLP